SRLDCGRAPRFRASRDIPSTALRSGSLPKFPRPWSSDQGVLVSFGFPSSAAGRVPVAPAKSALSPATLQPSASKAAGLSREGRSSHRPHGPAQGSSLPSQPKPHELERRVMGERALCCPLALGGRGEGGAKATWRRRAAGGAEFGRRDLEGLGMRIAVLKRVSHRAGVVPLHLPLTAPSPCCGGLQSGLPLP